MLMVKKTGERIYQNVVKNTKHEEYTNALLNQKMARKNMKTTQSKLHKIGTFAVCNNFMIKDRF